MAAQNTFPRDLLLAPVEQRLHYFTAKIVAHPHLKQTYETLVQALAQPLGISLIFVIGPTGVGKTTLRRRVEQHLLEQAMPELAQDTGRIPVVGIEAVAPELGNFNWKDYYYRALLALDEPLLRDKVNYGVRGLRRRKSGQLVIGSTVATAELRRALEQCLRYRRPTAFIVDEAQHLAKVAGGHRMLDQMDCLKSLASLTSTVHVLVGTYKLLGLTNLSAQLSRRSLDIHFPRYRADCAQEVETFKRVLMTFQNHLPLREEPDLVSHYPYLYERSVGCVGILKNWLNRALTVALYSEHKTLTLAHLEQTAEPIRKLLRLAREIKEGEAALQERADLQAELSALLGMIVPDTDPNVPALQTTEPEPGSITTVSQTAANVSPRRGRAVGQRYPVRDTVGRAS